MRSLRWILGTLAVIVVIGLIIIAAIGAWLNSYIHSDAFKAEVESRAARSLGGAVTIGQVDFGIFSGVKIQDLNSQVDAAHDGGQGALQLKVATVNCTYDWTELLSRKLKLTGLTLDQPQIVLTKEHAAPAQPQPNVGGPDSGATQGEGTAMPFQFILDRIRIKDGTVSVLDASGAAQINLQGLNVTVDTSGYTAGKGVTGTIKIADIAAPSNMHLTNFSTPFTCSASGIAANPFEASAYNGKIAGDFQANTGSPSILNCNGKGFDVAQLTEATHSNSSAKLTGTLDFQSKWRGIETGNFDGEGDAQITDGKLEGVKILDEISQVLKIKELHDPVIKKGQTHFAVRDRQTQITGLQIESAGFNITGDGTINFDGALNMHLVLILSRDAMGKLPSQLSASFVKQPDGTGTIGFDVTGTTSNPATNLPERLLLQNTQIQNVLNKALNKFFH
jgi:uncharacterized protein involved in outer membrane biogenesis